MNNFYKNFPVNDKNREIFALIAYSFEWRIRDKISYIPTK